MALDVSDDTTQQHHGVFDQSVWRFVSFDRVLQHDLCVAILSYTISERDYCWPRVIFPRDLFVTERVDESAGSQVDILHCTELCV